MKGKVLAVTALIGSALISSCKDFFPENNIPLILPRGNPRVFINLPKDKVRYIFFSFPDYEDEAEFLASYALKNLGTKKIALFYQNDDYGKGAIPGVENAVRKLPGKAEFVASVPYEVTERVLGDHALKLKESGADTILIYSTMSQAAIILKEMAKLGYRPKIMTSFPMADTVMFKLAGELWEGVYVAGAGYYGIPGVDADADKVSKILEKYDPNTTKNRLMACGGAVSMMYVAEGLKNAGRDLTVDKLIEGMEKIKDWKPEGLGAPVTFSRDRHHGNNSSRLLQAQGGKYIPITDFVSFKPKF
jgi:ABC-type branched-subunit amino acid transport system substrate-binding protein